MHYYISEMTYAVKQDGTKTLLDVSNHSFEDPEGNALDTAEQRFYNKIADELEFEAENCVPDNMAEDYLHEQIWTLDAAGTMLALKISITESQIRRNMAVCNMNVHAASDDNMCGAVLLGEAIVQSQYSDVAFERERLWKRRDGGFTMEISRKFLTNHQISWETTNSILTPFEAKTWAQKHMNSFQCNLLFGNVSTDDDLVPVGLMIRKDHKEQLKQRAQQEGKSFDELLNEALTGFLQ
jgi:hypothetical protein